MVNTMISIPGYVHLYRSLFVDGWKRKTAALTAQRYSFTNRCCF